MSSGHEVQSETTAEQRIADVINASRAQMPSGTTSFVLPGRTTYEMHPGDFNDVVLNASDLAPGDLIFPTVIDK